MDQDQDFSYSSSSDSEVSTVLGDATKGDRDAEKQISRLASSETKKIQFWRIFVMTLLLAAGAAVTVSTLLYLKNEQENEGRDSFTLFANTIEDASRSQIQNLYEANRVFSRELTANSMSALKSFPFSTTDIFEVYGNAARARAKMEFVSLTLLVTEDQRLKWEEYSTANQGWQESSLAQLQSMDKAFDTSTFVTEPINPYIYNLGDAPENLSLRETGRGPFAPIWQTSPPGASFLVNYNAFSSPLFPSVAEASLVVRDFLFGPTYVGNVYAGDSRRTDKAGNLMYPQHMQHIMEFDERATEQPHVTTVQPVFDSLDADNAEIVGWLWGMTSYMYFLVGLLPEGVAEIYLVIRNACGESFTYTLDESNPRYIGVGDLHDKSFDHWERVVDFTDNYAIPNVVHSTEGHCNIQLSIYPTAVFHQAHSRSTLSIVFPVLVGVIFIVVVVAFCMFDRFVQRRNLKVVGAAVRSNAIISSLFPVTVRDRLFNEGGTEVSESTSRFQEPKSTLRVFLSGVEPEYDPLDDDEIILKTKPIADLFPRTTIMFGDICGFTAWSSVREPSQVFMLLETVYRAFDGIAKRRRVFKVETIGDCYVAVCGLPDPRKDHAVCMARFARDCMLRMKTLTKKLEVFLGPDTGDLSMRIGLHSGPVTAGVLRGERSRFQLFGDTMNTAARMESTGSKGRVQLSQETADLLIAAGKHSWLRPREDRVFAKGKGEMQTQWLDLGEENNDAASIGVHRSIAGFQYTTDSSSSRVLDTKLSFVPSGRTSRLIEWNVDVLHRLLRLIVARRNVHCGRASTSHAPTWVVPPSSHTVLDEVKEIITLPKFDPKAVKRQQDPDSIELDSAVTEQLSHYISSIAALYRDNPFHNFEHAAHVTMSVVKLLARIVAPSEIDIDYCGNSSCEELSGISSTAASRTAASTLHDHTYGITSDPLTQFACVLSALIHDVDHAGVPNAQLVKEESNIATYYKGKSVAEQNSVDLAWDLLMDQHYDQLRATIFNTEAEMKRFRQLVVNSVMATDIVDPELKELRNHRWAKAFALEDDASQDDAVVNRKATIVIEHLIQASDVAHTMQHWHVYRKWNERFFAECYEAYKNGRADEDPSVNWYTGELGFFDFYIIPLARKLKDCGVFGVSSDEYLNYALKNRQEWASRGRQILSEMIEHVEGREVIEHVGAREVRSWRRELSERSLSSATDSANHHSISSANKKTRDAVVAISSALGRLHRSSSVASQSNTSPPPPVLRVVTSKKKAAARSFDTNTPPPTDSYFM